MPTIARAKNVIPDTIPPIICARAVLDILEKGLVEIHNARGIPTQGNYSLGFEDVRLSDVERLVAVPP